MPKLECWRQIPHHKSRKFETCRRQSRPEHAEIRHKNSSKEQYKVLESKAHGFRGHKNVTNAIFWLDLHWHQVQRIAAGGASVCCQRTVTCSITCLQSRRMAHTVRSKQETWSLIHAPRHARLYLRQRLARTDGTYRLLTSFRSWNNGVKSAPNNAQRYAFIKYCDYNF